MRPTAWAVVCVGWLVGTTAEAHEYPLHPVASGAAIPGVLTLTPWELDVTDPDYTLGIELRNDTDQWLLIPLQGARCLRGELVTAARGPTRPLVLAPYESENLMFVCDHGRWVTGDFGLVLPEVATSGDGRTPDQVVAMDVTWQLRERDVSRERQRESDGMLARLSFCRPDSCETPEPAVGAGPRPPTAILSPR